MSTTTIHYFEYAHLPEALQQVAKPIAELAHLMEDTLPDGPEKSAGMRKLLEAKDCFVRTKVVTNADKIQRSRIDGIYQACKAVVTASGTDRDVKMRIAVGAIQDLSDFELSQHKGALAKTMQVSLRDLERMIKDYREKYSPDPTYPEKTDGRSRTDGK